MLQKFKEYLQDEKKYSVHTITAYIADVQEFVFFLGETKTENINDINFSLIRNWIVSLVENNISNRSINRKIASLKAYYRFLIQSSVIEKSPLLKYSPLKFSKKIAVPFSKKEMSVALKQTDKLSDFKRFRNQTILELFYVTGIRRAELINLKISNIDFENKHLKILGKGNKERIVPLLEETIKGLKKYLIFREKMNLENLNEVFLTDKGKKMYGTLVYNIINSYLGAVSTKQKKSPHMLRHTFATHLLDSGANINAVKDLLGHTSLVATQVYTHSSLSELKKQYEKGHPRMLKKE